MLFKNIKEIIRKLATNAVTYAEKELGTGKGQEKKELAIATLVQALPVASPFKLLISKLLSTFIDESIECAVTLMNKEKTNG